MRWLEKWPGYPRDENVGGKRQEGGNSKKEKERERDWRGGGLLVALKRGDAVTGLEG